MSQDEVSVSLTIRDVSEKDSGSYTLEASNDLGSVSTSGQLDVQGQYLKLRIQIPVSALLFFGFNCWEG